MARRRTNPTALDNPTVSIVTPVYNERGTIEEILRRVVDTDIRKEVIIVDDCSTDGTRQILENMAAQQANNEEFAQAQDGSDPIALRDLRFFFQTPNRARGRRCGAGSLKPPAILCSCKTLTSNTTRATTQFCLSPSLMAGQTSFMARGFSAGRSAFTTFGTMWPTACSLCSRIFSPI